MYLAATQTLTHAYIHTRTLPPLLSYPVAMEPVAKAERYVVGMEVLDEGDDDNDGDVHEDDDDDRDRANNPPPLNFQVRPAFNCNASLGFARCNVGGRSDA